MANLASQVLAIFLLWTVGQAPCACSVFHSSLALCVVVRIMSGPITRAVGEANSFSPERSYAKHLYTAEQKGKK